MVNKEPTSHFLTVSCKCGRILRAKVEQAGTEIRCWDCQRMVLVPVPHQTHRVARELSEVALVAMQGPGLNSVLVAASIVTVVLAIPIFGTWCSVIALTLGGSAYGETIRRVGQGSTETPDASWWRTLLPDSIIKAILCLLMSAGTFVPLWILNAGVNQSPHWTVTGRAIAATTWLVLPLLMLGTYGQTGQQERLGVRGALNTLAKHPIATLLALAVIPGMMVLIEIGLGLIFFATGSLHFFAVEFMPLPQEPCQPQIYEGIPYYNLVDFRRFGDWFWQEGYYDGLRHGYSFVAAIPPSLANMTQANLDPWMIGLNYEAYFVARLVVVMVIMTCLMTAFAIQARWLGSILTLDRERPGRTAPRPPDSTDSAPSTRSDRNPCKV